MCAKNNLKLSLSDLSQKELITIIEASGAARIIGERHIAILVLNRKILQIQQLDKEITNARTLCKRQRSKKDKRRALRILNAKVERYNKAGAIITRIFKKYPELKKEFLR